jgi:hypothetical protein
MQIKGKKITNKSKLNQIMKLNYKITQLNDKNFIKIIKKTKKIWVNPR